MEEQIKVEICKLFPSGSNVVQIEGSAETFSCHIKLSISKREEFTEWLNYHSLLSGVKYVMMKTSKEKGYLYNATYGCRQNKRKPKSADQLANCKSTLRVMIKKTEQNSTKGKTLLRPTTVFLNYCHNHEIFSAEEARPNLLDEGGFHERLTKLFPENTDIVYAVRYGSDKDFVCQLKVDVSSKEDFNKWLEHHSLLSYVTYRVKKTEAKDKSLYNAYYRCHHNTFPRKDSKPHRKHTNCNATLHVVIKEKTDNSQIYRAKITLHHLHNHEIMTTAVLVHRDPSHDTREKFLSLFRNGVGPAQAFHIHHADLKETYDKDYNNIMYDRHICPDRQWVYRLYYSVYDEKQRSSQFQATIDNLNVQIFNLNNSDEACAEMKVTDDKEIVIAICSPLMRRAHLLKSAGDVVFVNSTGNSDRFNFKVMVLMCDSDAGGLPIGVLLMTSEKDATIAAALSLYQNIIPEEAFCGRGKEGPMLFVTDDSTSQKACLQHSFPKAKFAPCVFRMIQAAWKWIMSKRSDIQMNDRMSLFNMMINIFTTTNKEEFLKQLGDCISSELAQSYPSFIKYLEVSHVNKDRLDDYFLFNMESQEDREIGILELSVRVLKDCSFKKIKSYNLLQSFEFFTQGYSNYYAKKMLTAIGIECEQVAQSEYIIKFIIDDLEVNYVNEAVLSVTDKKNNSEHQVRGDLLLCDCYVGVCCNPCKHQEAVVKFSEDNFPNKCSDSKMRLDLHHIATGQVLDEGELLNSLETYDLNQENLVLILTNEPYEDFESMETTEEVTESLLSVEETLDEESFWTEMNRFSDKLLPLFRNNPRKMMVAWKNFSDKIYDINDESELISLFEIMNEQIK